MKKPDFFKRYRSYEGLLRSPYDARDYKYKDLVPLGAVAIPDRFETPLAPWVYNQGTSSMCAACAYNYLRFLQESDDISGSGLDVPLSPAFTYANRLDGEDFEGMYLRSVCKKGRDGSVPYSAFPGFFSYRRCKAKFRPMKEQLMEMAYPFRITSFYQCNSRAEVQTAIMKNKAAITGVMLHKCFYNPDWQGRINYDPKVDTKDNGGHAILLVGWMTDEDGTLWWKILNSWGKDYGINGTAWIPESYAWTEAPWAIVDEVFEAEWKKYKLDHNL